MKKILFLFLLFGVFAFAGNNIGNDILGEFKNATSSWWDVFKQAGLYIFWSFALIEVVTSFGFMLLRGELEIGGIFAQLMKIILLFGVFLFFIDNKDALFDIVQSFETLADRASGEKVSLDTITDYALDTWIETSNAVSIFDGVGQAIVNSIAGLLAGLAILGLGLTLLVVYIKFFIMLNTSVLFFAFGAFSYTRQWAINAIVSFAKIGAELMIIKLLVALAFQVLPATAKVAMENETSMFTTLIAAAAFFSLANMVHGMVESVFSGGSIGNASGVGRALQMTASASIGAAVGAAAGARGAIDSINAAKDTGSGSGGIMKKVAAGFAGATVGAAKGVGQSMDRGISTQGAGMGIGSFASKIGGGNGQASKDFAQKVQQTLGNSGTIKKGD